MAKPICVIYYFPESLVGRGKLPTISEMNEFFEKKFLDYYTLAIPSYQSADGSCEDLRLQVFHEKDFTEIQYAELKKLIEDSLEQMKK